MLRYAKVFLELGCAIRKIQDLHTCTNYMPMA